MKKFKTNSPPGILGKLMATIALLAVLAAGGPSAFAATSGNTTVYNEATVTYDSGASTGLTASDSQVVTVATLAAAPTVSSSSAGLTVLGGADAVYTLTVTSNANGVDTYTGSVNSQVNTGVSAPTDSFSAAQSLWGGIIVQDTTVLNQFEVPGGSIGANLSIGDTVVISGNVFTVATITAGNAQTTTPTDEVYDVVTLTPAGSDLAIGTGAGTQVGERGTITFTQTAGTPTVVGTDGTHAQNARITTTATLADNATAATTDTAITTTVSSPAVTILKEARNLDATTPTWVSDGSTTAKPGERIEYRITLTNTSGTGDATNVYLTDTIPAYTTFITGAYSGADVTQTYSVGPATTLGTAATAGDSVNLTGSTLTISVGATPGNADTSTGDTIAAGENVVVLYRVTVN